MYRHYKPAHSDFLIHWTGKDIDEKYDNNWTNVHSSSPKEEVTDLHLNRLKSILKHGLWMTTDENDDSIKIAGGELKRPNPARICFTELKLSMVRSHAAEYGRLGIGFKRPFLFQRLGTPIVYYQENYVNWFLPPFFQKKNEFNEEDFFSSYLKKMTKRSSDTTLEYKFYDESEWRIIFSDDIEKKLQELDRIDIIEKFAKPEKIKDEDFVNYLKDSKKKPKYIMPIKDQWFSLIIYPSLYSKVVAESDPEIQNLIEEMKPLKPKTIKYSENPATFEKYSKPIQIDLDACRNF